MKNPHNSTDKWKRDFQGVIRIYNGECYYSIPCMHLHNSVINWNDCINWRKMYNKEAVIDSASNQIQHSR